MNETGQMADARMERRPTTWVAFLVTAVVAVLVTTAGVKSARNLEATRSQAATLEAQIEQARLRIESLEARLVSLNEDPATLERLAREELGMVRPGDVVIVLPPPDDSPSEPDPARSRR